VDGNLEVCGVGTSPLTRGAPWQTYSQGADSSLCSRRGVAACQFRHGVTSVELRVYIFVSLGALRVDASLPKGWVAVPQPCSNLRLHFPASVVRQTGTHAKQECAGGVESGLRETAAVPPLLFATGRFNAA
jgi:hypothetical protein